MSIKAKAVSIIIALTIFNAACVKDSYIRGMMNDYTQITNYKIEKNIHSDNQPWYFKTAIKETDGKKLLQLHKFTVGFDSIDLRLQERCAYITRKPDFLYYLDDAATGHYRYVLLCLSPDLRHVEIYDSVGD